MLKSLKIENWKSHISTNLSFEAGPNLLVGIMGSGKSSVAEAMSFALFGTFPALQTKKVTLDQIILSEPQKDRASIEMQFLSSGKNYTIRREIRRGKGSSAEISVDGEVVDVNPKNVNDIVRKTLGMDYDLFSKAIYSEQNGIDYFLRIPKGQRMGHIDRLLKLDRYESAREGCVSLRNKVKARASGLMRVIDDIEAVKPSESLKKVEAEIKKLDAERASILNGSEELAEKIKNIQSQLQTAETDSREIDRLKAELGSLQSALIEMDKTITQKRKKIGDEIPKDISGLKAERRIIEKQIAEKKEKERSFREEKASLNTTVMMLKERDVPELNRRNQEKIRNQDSLQGLEKQFPEIETILPDMRKELEQLKRERSELENKRDEIKNNMNALEVGKCPTCEQEVTPLLRRELEKKRKDLLSVIGLQFSQKTVDVEKLIEKVDRLEDAYKQMTLLRSQLKNYEDITPKLREIEKIVKENDRKATDIAKQIDVISAEIRSMEKTSTEIATRIERTQNLIDERSLLKQLEADRKEKETKRHAAAASMAVAEKALAGIDISAMRTSLVRLTSEEASSKSRLSSLGDLLSEKARIAKSLDEQISKLKKYKKDVETDEKVMEVFQKFSEVLSITQQQLREEFVKSVNGIMTALWPEIYPYGDFSEIMLGVDGDYVLQLKRGDEWLSADGIASGGERSLACLALRIAFSLAFMPKLRWLMLDEPTHNLDRNAVEKLSEVLRERSHLFAEQVFLITHDERLSEGLPSIRLERDKLSGGHTTIKNIAV
ncbi:MAG: SMC family ATPase [Candidatus Aenigmatarchaeota archaeon]